MDYKTTAEIPISKKLVDQVIGQERAVEIIKKAAKQRRNLMLMGEPGTGKSMLAQAMAELMPAEALEDVLIYPNVNDENRPVVRVVKTKGTEAMPKLAMMAGRLPGPQAAGIPGSAKAGSPQVQLPEIGQGRRILEAERMKFRVSRPSGLSPTFLLFIALFIGIFILSFTGFTPQGDNKWILAASIIGIALLASAWIFSSQLQRRLGGMGENSEPKLVVDNTGMTAAPFIDATGAKAGALFGDVKHDPLQSGGLGTPAHLRVEAGAIHRANKGVLFVDEVSSLGPKSQQELLTAMQEKKYSITGQSEMSSGALVKTEPLPCDFVLIAAGNMLDIKSMHPALRSRIRGYGYEIYMEATMPDTPANRDKIVQFVAQEVTKDGKIPHFLKEAVDEIIEEAKRRAGRKGRLSIKFRDLGGIIRAAGDVAKEENAPFTTLQHVNKAKKLARTLEQQISQQVVEARKDYPVFSTTGYSIGKVNGLAVMGDASAGLVMPIVAEVTPASSKSEGKLIATGKLGKIAKEAVENVSAIIKKHIGRDVSQYDIHVQFLQTYEGVEGDSASIAVAVSVISAMEGIPVDQSIAMTGSLSVRGEVLPVGGLTAKVEAAADSGALTAIVPKSNLDDIYLGKDVRSKIKIVPVSNIVEVLGYVLKDSPQKTKLLASMTKVVSGKAKR
ncbi:MAG: ATP-dependent protease LonB [Candidatus Micrarchaeia archaeon]|jgi:Lon-like ATP-dependent protease